MPCFLAGENQGRVLAGVLHVPFCPVSHQQGHIAAAAWSAGRPELLDAPLLAWASVRRHDRAFVCASTGNQRLRGAHRRHQRSLRRTADRPYRPAAGPGFPGGEGVGCPGGGGSALPRLSRPAQRSDLFPFRNGKSGETVGGAGGGGGPDRTLRAGDAGGRCAPVYRCRAGAVSRPAGALLRRCILQPSAAQRVGRRGLRPSGIFCRQRHGRGHPGRRSLEGGRA